MGIMDKDQQKVVVTWIGRMEGVNHKNVKKALKELTKEVKSIIPSAGTLYGICENFDTYQHGGLFPLLHLSEDSGVVNKFLNTDSFLDSDVLGPGNMVDQGVFEEVACITPQIQGSGTTNSVMAVSAFKSIDASPNAKLIKEWKQWTGARAFLQDIVMAGLECTKIRFLVKVAPTEEPEGFYYILTTEVSIREPSDEGLFVDTLQRFRVERWFGYNTIYRKIG
ncbi:uncharacterized protein LOC134767226 [Penaeus indicus]|uniref:uncharacterized protein LOC134767226 n=1 Tax=Penaeus indicus TaxID=29960 RepID=UPI00300CDCDB